LRQRNGTDGIWDSSSAADHVANPALANALRLTLSAHAIESQAKNSAAPGDEAKLTRMLLAMADVRVVLIVLAARLHHLRGLTKRRPGGSPGSALADETLRVFAPLANRLGVWSLKAEMEDLCFQVRHAISATCRCALIVCKVQVPRGLARILLAPTGAA